MAGKWQHRSASPAFRPSPANGPPDGQGFPVPADVISMSGTGAKLNNRYVREIIRKVDPDATKTAYRWWLS
ncbi:hypothetical protein [Paracoccus methylarcula]|uniref:hypothetical protein n=1 Tax=Paracoccus methylarcula TaxID=72022 RepID=UPI000D0F719E|nr:hypothetical protein [Paracoccus methylarcula]